MPKIVDHDERRQQIIAALWRVVDQQGADAVSVRNVAAEAGMSKSNLATYVGSVGQLLALATQDLVGEVSKKIIAMDLFNIDHRVAVEAMLQGIPLSPERRVKARIWLLLLTSQAERPELQDVLIMLNNEVRSGIETILQAMQHQGSMSSDRDVALEAAKIHGLIDGLSLQVLSSPGVFAPDEIRHIMSSAISELSEPITATRP